jgi:hypothetical protein
MSEPIKPGGSRIRYEGIFDWKELYAAVHEWCSERKFDFYERKHIRKPMTYGNEIEYEAEAERKETAYIKYTIKIYIHAYNVEDVELVIGGKKVQKNKAGMLIIDVTPTMELDYDDKWEKSSFLRKTRKFVHKYLIWRYIRQWRDKIYYEANDLYMQLKEMLDLESKYSAYRK